MSMTHCLLELPRFSKAHQAVVVEGFQVGEASHLDPQGRTAHQVTVMVPRLLTTRTDPLAVQVVVVGLEDQESVSAILNVLNALVGC